MRATAAGRRAVLLLAFAALATGCQYVFGVDFVDDPKLAGPAGQTPPSPGGGVTLGTCAQRGSCPGKIGGEDTRPCAPGEPDCTTDPSGAVSRGPAGTTHVTSLASGVRHVCTIVDGGRVKCFGFNAAGELGDDATTESATAVSVAGLTNVKALAAGSFHTCALLEAGSVKCWGSNGSGELGDGTLETRLVPVDVPALGTSVVALAAGAAHTCALLAGGAVKCWGANDAGQLGNNSKTASRVPVDVPVVATSISSGVSAEHTCASTASGVKCWGSNRRGQLGNGTAVDSLVPTDVVGVGPAALAAGVSHTCALTADGVFCWGDNREGELGNDNGELSTTPAALDGLAGATRLACGTHHCCVALASGVTCWGSNGNGQLGDLPTAPRQPPVMVSGGLTALDGVAGGESYSCARNGQQLKCWGESLGVEDPTGGTGPFDIGGL